MQFTPLNFRPKFAAPQVMGILNVTPDSFYDGGKYQNISKCISHAATMIDYGATIIDVGGESTRPGAKKISEDEEVTRVIPVVSALTQRFDVCVSVDTSKTLVMKESAAAGAHMINDVRSLNEPGALDFAASNNLYICLMHMRGEPSNMQQAPYYNNVTAEVKSYLLQQIKRCEKAGINKDRLLIDPGFGFGKTLEHNYQLLTQLGEFHDLKLPLLVGMSRKSMVGQVLKLSIDNLMVGSVTCAIIAALQGALIVRTHDVKETVEAMRIVKIALLTKKIYFK